jgi:cyclopropane fatty-acyl-phospholipid synthase-like methyltransferase
VLPLLDEEPSPLPPDAPKWRRRWHALWWGYSLEPEAGGEEKDDAAAGEDQPIEPDMLWSPLRISAVQTLFGDGMIGPGGETALAALVRPCTLNSQKSAVELGAGLGGLCRWAHGDAGTYFKAFEADDVLAAAGMAISTRKGLTNKCPVDHAAIEKFEVRPKSQDAIIAKEAFYRVADKVGLFSRILEALKPSGIVSCSDYMSGTPQDPLVQAAFPGSQMLAPDAERAAATKAGFDVRVFEDRTGEHIKATLDAFEAFAHQVKTAPPPDQLRDAVLKEGELWTARLNLLQTGKVSLYRMLAVNPL